MAAAAAGFLSSVGPVCPPSLFLAVCAVAALVWLRVVLFIKYTQGGLAGGGGSGGVRGRVCVCVSCILLCFWGGAPRLVVRSNQRTEREAEANRGGGRATK